MYLHQEVKVNEEMEDLNLDIDGGNGLLHHRFHHWIYVVNKDEIKQMIRILLRKDNNQIQIWIYEKYPNEISVENH
jgi:hypothetical protein